MTHPATVFTQTSTVCFHAVQFMHLHFQTYVTTELYRRAYYITCILHNMRIPPCVPHAFKLYIICVSLINCAAHLRGCCKQQCEFRGNGPSREAVRDLQCPCMSRATCLTVYGIYGVNTTLALRYTVYTGYMANPYTESNCTNPTDKR